MHVERVLNVFRERMHLQREILPAHRIEEIEADRIFVAESAVHARAQQFLRAIKHHVDRRNFHANAVKRHIYAVLFGYAVERPRVIRRAFIEVADLFHPLPAPHFGREIRHETERLGSEFFKPRAEAVALRHRGIALSVRIQQVIDFFQQAAF